MSNTNNFGFVSNSLERLAASSGCMSSYNEIKIIIITVMVIIVIVTIIIIATIIISIILIMVD